MTSGRLGMGVIGAGFMGASNPDATCMQEP